MQSLPSSTRYQGLPRAVPLGGVGAQGHGGWVGLAGERIWNLGGLLKLREGFQWRRDYLFVCVLNDVLADGPAAVDVLPREVFQAVLDEYYGLRGWDEEGVPTPVKLAELGLEGL